jgi:uncharacterized lipoprotein
MLRKAVCACVCALVVSACALSEDIVPVNYAAPKEAAPIAAAGKTFKLDVVDNRGVYRGQIGAKVNGWGQEMAAIRSTVPVRDIVRNALIDELKLRKIAVDDAQVRAIDISITAMHNNFQTGFASGSARGIVTFTVKVVATDGSSRFNATVSEIHEETGIQIASGENAAKAVEGALAKAMKALFDNRDFIAVLAGA